MLGFYLADLQPWIIIIGFLAMLPTTLLLIIVISGTLIDGILSLTTKREFRFLYLPLPFPSVSEKAVAMLQQLKINVQQQITDSNAEVCHKYIEAIDLVLDTRSREALLYLHALRRVLQREVRERGT